MGYDDARFYTIQHMHFGTAGADQTSVIATRVELDRKTVMTAITVKDWNVQVIQGDTCTGAIDYNLAISKSLGGTGTVTPFGSAVISSGADGAILDQSLTETNLVAGDDIVVSYEVGTSLPAGVLKVEADVSYVEHFVGG